ncbi:hypothetical protein, conserved [Eimeria maxima]|uniref:Replication protein A OB domain-containing protein n=1 Tax=Eimeria maxima TaxID=5804 RepID=U6M4L0_EIMMA|nr:hypothetical protein, conserved [Eimeria maxima]CDJ59147.1 hypothetical protein, conserved [Eimeria maxima]
MQLHNGQQQTEASAPPSPVLSVGFWDAFAAGCMWSEPVLAALSFSPLGKDHILVLATDGSIQVKTKENTPSKKNAADGAKEQQEEQQQHLAGGGGEQQQSEENRGRWTPVVTELQLLPGQWSRPRCQLVMQPHRLYAAESGGEEAPKHRGNSPSKSTEETKRTPSEGQLPTAAAAKRAKKNNGSSNEGRSEIKTFANAKGESILFTVHLIDAQATEIRATFFGRAASHWHPRLSVGKVYTFSKGTLQRANRLHNSLPHEVQIKFDASVEIDEVGDDPSIPLQKFERVYLGDLPRFPPGSVVDVLGFVVGAKEVETVLSRTKNEQLLRRELTLLDASESPVFFTLFGAQALQLPHSALEDNPLVAIKGAKVQEYGGRSCLVSSAQMQITFLQRAHATETNRSTRAAAAPATQRQMQAEKETTEENMAHTGGSSRTQTPIFAGVAAADVQGELDWFSAKGAAILNTLEDYGPKAAFPLTLGEVGRAVQHLHLEEVGSSRAFNVIGSLLDLQGAHLFWL